MNSYEQYEILSLKRSMQIHAFKNEVSYFLSAIPLEQRHCPSKLSKIQSTE
jgi:hypothetical protein